MPPIEALACGCVPLLHPGVGAAEMYALDGKNAISLDESIHEVAERISWLLSDLKSLESMRRLAPESIRQFDPEGYGRRLLQAGGFLPESDSTESHQEGPGFPSGC
jgi:glycosyltransferase involved in cell wall biosynthesis